MRQPESEAPEVLGSINACSVGVTRSCWLRSLAGLMETSLTVCRCTVFSAYSSIKHLLTTYYVADPLLGIVTKLEIATREPPTVWCSKYHE